jgi:penicillin-binding protein 1A
VLSVPAVYTPALDTNNLTLGTVKDDSEYTIPETSDKVENEDSVHKGLTTIRDAIVNPNNVVAAKLMEDITYETSYDYLKHLGVTNLVTNEVNTDIDAKLGMGEMVNGISNLELTGAYATIANGGVYNYPIFYSKILDNNEIVVIENDNPKTRVLREETCWLLKSAMQQCVEKGRAEDAKSEESSMAFACQTGTSLDHYDAWIEGFNPYLTCGIWVGYDNRDAVVVDKTCSEMWLDIQTAIIANNHLMNKEFDKPDNIVERTICPKSGLLAIKDICDNDNLNSDKRVEYFRVGTEPKDYCHTHAKYSINKKTKEPADEFLPDSDREERVYIIKNEKSETLDTPFVFPKPKEDEDKDDSQASLD